MTDSLDYDIAQLQTDLNRLQSDLARLENDLNSEMAEAVIGESNPLVAEEIAEAEILAGEEIAPASIIPEPVVYENQGWSPTPISTTSMMDEEIAQAELAQAQKALTTAAEALTDAEVANILTHSNMENMNMINHPNRSQKIRNAIASLLAAASTLIAAEAGAMWEEGEKAVQKSLSKKLLYPEIVAGKWYREILDNKITEEQFDVFLNEARNTQSQLNYKNEELEKRNSLIEYYANTDSFMHMCTKEKKDNIMKFFARIKEQKIELKDPSWNTIYLLSTQLIRKIEY